jgi:hypothetical protein
MVDPLTFELLLKITNPLIPSTNGIFLPIERTNIPPPNTTRTAHRTAGLPTADGPHTIHSFSNNNPNNNT